MLSSFLPQIFRPISATHAAPTPVVAYVWKTEEKGSDVNLGAHLVRDAFLKKFDIAAVLTNDTDLAEPIRRTEAPDQHPSGISREVCD